MARVESTMLPLGTHAPDFDLPDAFGLRHQRADFDGSPALLVMFICNHCPFVKLIAQELAKLHKDYQNKGVHFVGISSNDISTHPEDSPELMKQEAAAQGYAFPYLYDESQSVAKAYRAACTPDIFVFDSQNKLAYRGQIDDARPRNGKPVNGADLRAALDAILSGTPIPEPQRPSIGCNIKWVAGNEPDYFNPTGVQ